MTAWWPALVTAAVGCYLLKLAGLALPTSLLGQAGVQRVVGHLPVAMLAALVATNLFAIPGPTGRPGYGLDWHTCAGVGAGLVALLLRRGFLVVFTVAVGVTALLRWVA